MGILDLPAELLDGILDASLPLSIEGLALTCKTIYMRAARQIQRHNALKRRWARTTQYTSETHDILRLLYDLSRDPLATEYIEYLTFCGDDLGASSIDDEHGIGNEDTGRDHAHNEERAAEAAETGGAAASSRESVEVRELSLNALLADREVIATMKLLLTSSSFYHHTAVSLESWWSYILAEHSPEPNNDERYLLESSYPAIAVLGLLPNLKVLRLFPDWEDTPGNPEPIRTSPLLAAMIEAANADRWWDSPLGKLQALLPFRVAGYEEKQPLQTVEPFLSLGTLSELYLVSMVGVDDNYTGDPFTWRSAGVASSLTRIELASSCLDTDGLSALVSHTPNLTTFKYSHEAKWHGCQAEWNPGTFIEALAHYCGKTITDLAITIDSCSWIVNGASSFFSFPNLKHLEVDVELFCGPPVESGQREGLDPYIPDGATAWTKEDIPCIGSMMPAGIVDIQINTDYPDPDEVALTCLLKNLRSQRRERLHLLERVTIRQFGGDTARAVADSAGATLEVCTHTSRARMPQWKQEFNMRVKELRSGSRR